MQKEIENATIDQLRYLEKMWNNRAKEAQSLAALFRKEIKRRQKEARRQAEACADA